MNVEGRARPGALTQAARAATLAFLCACGGNVDGSAAAGVGGAGPAAPGSGGAAGNTTGGVEGSASGAPSSGGVGATSGMHPGAGSGSAGEGTAGEGCSDSLLPPRLVRLSFAQIASSAESLLGSAAVEPLRMRHDIRPLSQGPFPPLSSAREGTSVDDSRFVQLDDIASALGQYVLDNVASVTGCGAAPTEPCARAFIASFAERAFRQPLEPVERDTVLQVFDEGLALGAPVAEAIQYATYAVFSSPLFVYRRELGEPDTAGQRRLSAHEMASQLSFFITNAPPDAELLQAASAGLLATTAGLAEQVDRLLASPSAQSNLEQAVLALYEVEQLGSVVMDPSTFPAFSAELAASMRTESAEFLKMHLWDAPVESLLTSRRSRVNAGLAAHYGVTFPPAGAALDASGFAEVVLPLERSGLLTQAAMLTLGSRPDSQSVVERGLRVMRSLVCEPTPLFPDVIPEIPEVPGTEREKAADRAARAECVDCHRLIDPYGLALESFDAIGRYRTSDADAEPLDPAVTLVKPPVSVSSAAEMAAAIAASGAFAECLTQHFVALAVADGTHVPRSCDLEDIARARQQADDASFAGLVRQVALSKTLAVRSSGGAP